MAEEKKTMHWGVKTLLSTIGSSLLIFFAHTIWDSVGANEKAISELSGRIKALEDDRAKWEILTELNNRTVTLERTQAIHNNDVEWLKRSAGFPVTVRETAVPRLPSTTPPSPGAEPMPAPIPPPPSPPKLLPPDELRKLYEQRSQQKK
jgi:hypothetical protein